jgi:hypothetical protein
MQGGPMLLKHGKSLKSQENSDAILVMNPKGDRFQISYTAHMVWNMLDGDTELETIAQKIASMADVETNKMQSVVEEIVQGLKSVDLVG